MSKSLFLGWGKVTQGLSKICSGEQWVFVESEGSVEVSRCERGQLQPLEKRGGDFEAIDWKAYLPARVFLSPGIDPRRPFFDALKKFEVRELEEVANRFQGRLVGITGTDGKSTFTIQLGEILRRAFPERSIFVGGNLGNPLSEMLEKPYDLAVVELSSFQCERWQSATLDFGVLINLAPDHLDRYASLEDYYNQKWNLIRHSKQVFYPHDVSRPPDVKESSLGIYSNDSELSTLLKVISPLIVKDVFHPPKDFQLSWLEELPTLPHRLERWKAPEGGIFVNDSKATTVHASVYGLRRMQNISKKVRLILGGRAKGDDYGPLVAALRTTDTLAVAGEAADLIVAAAQRGCLATLRRYPSMKTLFEAEILATASDEILLLSPACSSYDEFQNFEDRGQQFIDTAQRLRGALTRVRSF